MILRHTGGAAEGWRFLTSGLRDRIGAVPTSRGIGQRLVAGLLRGPAERGTKGCTLIEVHRMGGSRSEKPVKGDRVSGPCRCAELLTHRPRWPVAGLALAVL